MKINIKSNNGVTITGLVIYVSSFFMICAIIAVITTFFANNTRFLSSEATASAEFDVLNAYLAKEAKEEKNIIDSVDTTNESFIKFSNYNQYLFKKNSSEEYGQIYLLNTVTNKYFIVANYVQDAKFYNNGESFSIEIKILNKNYTQTYNMSN